jgi:uncharacterized protein (TIGR03067 family)
MRHAIGLAFLAALAMPAWAEDKPTAEDEKLYGTWVQISVEDEKGVEPTPDGQVLLVFSKGGKITGMDKSGPLMNLTYRVNPTRSPRDFDLIESKDGGKKQETTKGIYLIEGDILKMSFPSDRKDADRPTAFDAKKAKIWTFKRQKP